MTDHSTDHRATLERARSRFPAPDLTYERVLGRRERKDRNQRVAAGVVGIAVAAAALFGFASLMRVDTATRPGIAEPHPTLSPSEPRPVDETDLRSIVYGSCRACDEGGPRIDPAPSGTQASSSAAGLQALRFAQPPQSLYQWPLDGFEGARVRAFLDPPSGETYVVSWAAVFVDSRTASEVMAGYVADVQDTWGWSGLRRLDPGLGDEGVLLEGEPRALSVFDAGGGRVDAPPTSFSMWRIDNLLLQVLAVGEYRADEIRGIAETMTERTASQIGPQAVVPADGEEIP